MPVPTAAHGCEVFVVGVAAGWTFAFVAEEAEEVHEVAVPPSGSQFRSRDAFPALPPRLVAGDRLLRAAPGCSGSSAAVDVTTSGVSSPG